MEGQEAAEEEDARGVASVTLPVIKSHLPSSLDLTFLNLAI